MALILYLYCLGLRGTWSPMGSLCPARGLVWTTLLDLLCGESPVLTASMPSTSSFIRVSVRSQWTDLACCNVYMHNWRGHWIGDLPLGVKIYFSGFEWQYFTLDTGLYSNSEASKLRCIKSLVHFSFNYYACEPRLLDRHKGHSVWLHCSCGDTKPHLRWSSSWGMLWHCVVPSTWVLPSTNYSQVGVFCWPYHQILIFISLPPPPLSSCVLVCRFSWPTS